MSTPPPIPKKPVYRAPKRVLILHALVTPALLLGWLWPVLCTLVGLAEDIRFAEGNEVWATWKQYRWLRKIWPYSTTLGYGCVGWEDHWEDRRLRRHEKTHKRQWQDDALRGLFIAAANYAISRTWGPEAAALSLYVFMPVFILTNFLSAYLRGAGILDLGFYRQSEHERSASAQTDEAGPNGVAWEDSKWTKGPVP